MLFSIVKILIGVSIGLVALVVLLYFSQDNLIFFPRTLSQEEADRIVRRYPNAENISIKAVDNTILKGWLVKNSILSKSPLIIYFGGNADEVSHLIPEAGKFKGWSLALINYRGYGLNRGKPTENDLLNDALSIYDYVSEREDVDDEKIIVMGSSLGTGVAVYLARVRRVRGVILVSPFESLASVARKKFPFLPVNLILRHHFDSISMAPFISAPLLVLTASEDTIIPPSHSKNLAEKWGGPHSITIIKGEGHNTISYSEIYWKSINDFLAQF